MPVDKFQKGLMAAGASPAKALQISNQRAFETGKPVGMTTAAGKPKVLGDPYDPKSQAASESLYPQGFRPPKPDSDNFKLYYDFVFGKGAYDKVGGKIDLSMAPNYSTAKTSQDVFDQFIVNQVEAGLSWPTVSNYIKGAVKNKQIAYPAGLLDTEAIDYAKDVWTEYNKYAKGKTGDNSAITKAIDSNQNFKYGLPDPRLRYGLSTSYGEGSVDILTNPTAGKLYSQYQKTTTDPKKLAKFKMYLLSEANKRQLTPWKDEVNRREALRGKKIGG